MRLLMLHSDYIRYEAKKKTRFAEETDKKSDEMREVLVVFSSVEKIDEQNPDLIVRKSADAIEEHARTVGTRNIFIYPYAHLSSELASPQVALDVLRKLEEELSSRGFNVKRAPFGWYKAFEIKCKGHPLAELSRTITPEEVPEEGPSIEEEKGITEFFILTPDGELYPIDSFDFSGHEDLRKFVSYEVAKDRTVREEPPHVRLMRRLEIADYEEGSDPGNLRWYPRGKMMREILEEYIYDRMVDYGAMVVETPIMYDIAHEAIRKHIEKFPERQYRLRSGDREMILRFAACFGQFLMLKDALITYRNLPLRIYELTRYSFRREKRGEVVGLRRLRAFTMPDMHTLCANMEQAKEEFERQFDLCARIMRDLEIPFEVAFRATKDFFDENKDWIVSMLRKVNKPALLEIFHKRRYYWVLKFEFNFVDYVGKAAALSTVQIDIESGAKFGITYVDKDNARKNPIILHCSPSGAIERVIYALLEKNAKIMDQNGVPRFPTWISPIQVRIIPVSENYLSAAMDLAKELLSRGIRVEVDDRGESVSKKIRDAETSWIPYIVVIGEKEIREGRLSVRIRAEGREVIEMSKEELIERLEDEIRGFPRVKQSIPILLSMQPRFVG